jgi:hypothetical protein
MRSRYGLWRWERLASDSLVAERIIQGVQREQAQGRLSDAVSDSAVGRVVGLP